MDLLAFFTGGLGLHGGAQRLGCAVIPASGGQTERQVQLILDLEPRIICCTPSYMLVLVEALERAGVDPRDTSLEIGIFGAEPWSTQMQCEIEARLGIAALDIYGLSEVLGPGVAQERADARGALTIWEDAFHPEIVDPATGTALPEAARKASSSSPRSPRKPCPSSAIARAISRACIRQWATFRSGAWTGSSAAATTC